MGDLLTTTFALDDPAPADQDVVLRRGKIFEAGAWSDKEFSLTPDELAAAVATFRPVPLDLEHVPTVLDGKLGTVQAVELADDGRALIGTVALPRWLDTVLGDGERKVSCTWDRATKQLARLALVRTPRIADAALFAAFAGARHSAADMADMQAIHDLVTKQGAQCDRRNVHYTTPQEHHMSLKEQLVALFRQLPDEDPIMDDPAPTPAPVATPTPAPVQEAAEFKAIQAELAAAQAALAATQAAERAGKAAAFAEDAIRAGKALPAERATLVACYAQALTDDAAQAVTVTFGADGSQAGSRADALAALIAARPAHALTKETLPAGTALFAVGATDPDTKQAAEAEFNRLLALTPLGKSVQQERK